MLRHPSLIPLSHEHQHGLALCVLIERALNTDSSPQNVSAQARTILEQFDLELQHHFAVEEKVLFPALAGFSELSGLVAELVEEHKRMTGIITRLRSGSEAELLREFVFILREHIRKEENRLFESAQRLLTEDELERLAPALAKRNS